jgi:hypothetical protein
MMPSFRGSTTHGYANQALRATSTAYPDEHVGTPLAGGLSGDGTGYKPAPAGGRMIIRPYSRANNPAVMNNTVGDGQSRGGE